MKIDCNQIITDLHSVSGMLARFTNDVNSATFKSNFQPIRDLESELDSALTSLEDKLFPREATLQEAMDIMGDRLLGPNEVKAVFGIDIKPEDVPPIHFSPEMLEKLKGSCRLILYTNRLPNGKPLTAQAITKLFDNKQRTGNPLVYNLQDTRWLFKETFFTTHTPVLEWRLVSDDLIRNTNTKKDSTSKNYLEQTKILAEYIQSLYTEDTEIPEDMQSAITETIELANDPKFQQEVISKDEKTWKEAAKKLANLPINQKFRESFVQLLYRLTLIDRSKAQQLLTNMWSWTNSRTSGGGFVRGGAFGSDVTGVSGWRPDYSFSSVGCAVSAVKL